MAQVFSTIWEVHPYRERNAVGTFRPWTEWNPDWVSMLQRGLQDDAGVYYSGMLTSPDRQAYFFQSWYGRGYYFRWSWVHHRWDLQSSIYPGDSESD